MQSWVTLWGILLIAALTLFAGVAIVVSIGGFADIREMLRRIDKEHKREGKR